MIRNLFLFLGTFTLGAIGALVVRAALFAPHADHAPGAHPEGGDYAPMVGNALTPAKGAVPTPAPQPTSTSAQGKPVNTVCAICGMEVDPSLPTAEYQGKTIGFGCRMCPPKFKADPDRYGPFYLRNEVIKR